MRAWFIRHAESTGNAGQPTTSPQGIPLSALGRRQAVYLADGFPDKPDVIVASPYDRAVETAQPLAARFGIPVFQWPCQEFTFLDPSRYVGTTTDDRRADVQAYWDRGDSDYRDGGGAESFADLLDRAWNIFDRLTSYRDMDLVVVFTHERFIRACRWVLVGGGDDMRAFLASCVGFVPNVSITTFTYTKGEWSSSEPLLVTP